MNTYSLAFMAHMRGEDTENAYAKVFGTQVIGGIGDGGLDVPTGDSDVPFVQIRVPSKDSKPSWRNCSAASSSFRFAWANREHVKKCFGIFNNMAHGSVRISMTV